VDSLRLLLVMLIGATARSAIVGGQQSSAVRLVLIGLLAVAMGGPRTDRGVVSLAGALAGGVLLRWVALAAPSTVVVRSGTGQNAVVRRLARLCRGRLPGGIARTEIRRRPAVRPPTRASVIASTAGVLQPGR
jgi:hypothetical protein